MQIFKLINSYFVSISLEKRNVIIVFLAKFVSFVGSYYSVTILLNILEKDIYGVWITLVGSLNLLYFFDFGIGNSLKNNIVSLLVEKNNSKIKQLILQTYFTSIVIAFFIFVLGFIFIYLFNLSEIFNTKIQSRELSITALILLGSISIQLILKNIIPILHSHQKIGIAEAINSISPLIILILTILLVSKNTSLRYLALLNGLLPIVILCISSYYFFKRNRGIIPDFVMDSVKFDKSVFKLGLNFFVIQLSGMILYSTDNFLISYLISPSEVPSYYVAMKYFNILTFTFGIFLIPVWTLVSQKYAEQNLIWIKDKTQNLLKVFFIFVLIGIVMLTISNQVYKIWIGDKLLVPFNLSLTLFFYIVVMMWCNLFAIIMNGIGKVKLQTYFSVLSIIINIPLSIIFIKYLNLGVIGIPLATCVSMIINGGLITLQYHLVINSKAVGIFNK